MEEKDIREIIRYMIEECISIRNIYDNKIGPGYLIAIKDLIDYYENTINK